MLEDIFHIGAMSYRYYVASQELFVQLVDGSIAFKDDAVNAAVTDVVDAYRKIHELADGKYLTVPIDDDTFNVSFRFVDLLKDAIPSLVLPEEGSSDEFTFSPAEDPKFREIDSQPAEIVQFATELAEKMSTRTCEGSYLSVRKANEVICKQVQLSKLLVKVPIQPETHECKDVDLEFDVTKFADVFISVDCEDEDEYILVLEVYPHVYRHHPTFFNEPETVISFTTSTEDLYELYYGICRKNPKASESALIEKVMQSIGDASLLLVHELEMFSPPSIAWTVGDYDVELGF